MSNGGRAVRQSAVHDPVGDAGHQQHEQDRGDERDDDHLQRLGAAQILSVAAARAHAEKHPADRPDAAPERAALRGIGAGPYGRVVAHVTPRAAFVPASAASSGAGGVFAPTWKKVYDSVIVVTSFGSFGSITNTTGHCFFSPGLSVHWLKQKHSILWKCAAAWRGA